MRLPSDLSPRDALPDLKGGDQPTPLRSFASGNIAHPSELDGLEKAEAKERHLKSLIAEFQTYSQYFTSDCKGSEWTTWIQDALGDEWREHLDRLEQFETKRATWRREKRELEMQNRELCRIEVVRKWIKKWEEPWEDEQKGWADEKEELKKANLLAIEAIKSGQVGDEQPMSVLEDGGVGYAAEDAAAVEKAEEHAKEDAGVVEEERKRLDMLGELLGQQILEDEERKCQDDEGEWRHKLEEEEKRQEEKKRKQEQEKRERMKLEEEKKRKKENKRRMKEERERRLKEKEREAGKKEEMLRKNEKKPKRKK